MGNKPQKKKQSTQSSFFDDWVKTELESIVSPKSPALPVLTELDYHVEKNQLGQVNGVNLSLKFAAAAAVMAGMAETGGLTVSREVKIEQDGSLGLYQVDVSAAVNASNTGRFKTYYGQQAAGECVSLRFGDEKTGTDTYFASQVPSSGTLEAVFTKIVKAYNENPVAREKFLAEGIVVTRNDVTTISIPADKIGYQPVLFCRIGQDSKPDLNVRGSYWSSTWQRGDAQLYARGTPTGETRQFRGMFFSRGGRSAEVAKVIEDQIKAHPKWTEITAIVGTPATVRAETKTEKTRFFGQAPEAIKAPSSTPAPVAPDDVSL